MKKILILLLSVAMSSVIASQKINNKHDKAREFLLKTSEHNVVILKEYDSINNLIGFVVQPKHDGVGHAVVVYVDKGGRYMFLGTLIGPNSQNISFKDQQKYILSKRAKNALSIAQSLTYIQTGKNKQHNLYVIAEPNCSLCHLFYTKIKDKLLANKIAIRWLPVTFLKSDSLGKAAAILQASSSEKAFYFNEDNFHTATEEGGVTPAKTVTKATQLAIEKNNTFMKANGFNGTPVILYKDKQGKAHALQGVPSDSELDDMLNNLGNTFNEK